MTNEKDWAKTMADREDKYGAFSGTLNRPPNKRMTKQKVCAIIGARKTPPKVIIQIQELAGQLVHLGGYFIRTGGAIGADQAAMRYTGSDCLVYQPWTGYEAGKIMEFGNRVAMTEPTTAAIGLASYFHPNWDVCSNGTKLLHGRNSHIILGKDLRSAVNFVICYSDIDIIDGKAVEKGGTALGCKIARQYKIPVYNLKLYSPEEILEFIKEKQNYKFESE